MSAFSSAFTPTQRGQWTSARAAGADALCPGRHRAQIGQPETTSPEATSGIRIHAWLAGHPPADLTPAELELAETLRTAEHQVVRQIFGDAHPACQRESRLWLAIEPGYWHTGQPDVVYLSGQTGLILDYKTGHQEVASAHRNQQLRDLAVLLAMNHDLHTVYVASLQSAAKHSPEITRYTNRELCPALDQLQKRVRACHDPAAPRVAGPVQCQFCRAKAVCPEARAAALSLTDIPPNVSLTVSAAEAAAQFTPEMLGQFLERAVVAEGVIAACREEARRRLNAGEIIPGWRLKPGQQRETITDPQACFDRCHRRGVPLIAFLSAIVLGDAFMEAVQFAASILLWGVVVRTVIVWHITWSVNSLAHVAGYQNYDTGDQSRNNFLVAILTSGEGWHNNHHSEPGCACNQRHWWEIDLVYYLLRLLVLVGLAWDVQMPTRSPRSR